MSCNKFRHHVTIFEVVNGWVYFSFIKAAHILNQFIQSSLLGRLSWIQRRGRFSMMTFVPPLLNLSPSTPSAERIRELRAGHGRTADADTVIKEAKNVSPKSEEMNDRRWLLVNRSGLNMTTFRKDQLQGLSGKLLITHL